jgi:hypothetical protein
VKIATAGLIVALAAMCSAIQAHAATWLACTSTQGIDYAKTPPRAVPITGRRAAIYVIDGAYFYRYQADRQAVFVLSAFMEPSRITFGGDSIRYSIDRLSGAFVETIHGDPLENGQCTVIAPQPIAQSKF